MPRASGVFFALCLAFEGCGKEDRQAAAPTAPDGQQDLVQPPPHPGAGGARTVHLPGGAPMDCGWIAPGSFPMGTTQQQEDLRRTWGWGSDGYHSDAQPAPRVTLSRGFWLGKGEVTQGQWEAVMGSGPWVGEAVGGRPTPQHPASYLRWDDAQRCVARLTAPAGQALYRLPTAAEWEYACRAGSTTRWSFGDAAARLGD